MKIYFNTWPEIKEEIYSLSIQYLLIEVFLFIFLALLFFLLIKILLLKFKINKIKEIRHNIIENTTTQQLEKLKSLTGKEFIKEFVNYLENIKIKEEYKNLRDILSTLNLPDSDIKNIENIIYSDSGDIEKAENTLRNFL